MTLDEIRAMDKELLTAGEVASVLHISPSNLSWQARTDPLPLGFPVVRIGNTVRFPRRAFVRFMEGLSKGVEA